MFDPKNGFEFITGSRERGHYHDDFLVRIGKFICFTPDDQNVVAGIDNNVLIRSFSGWNLVGELKGHQAPVWCMDLYEPDNLLATGDAAGVIMIWRLSDGELLHTIQAHTNIVHSLAFDPRGGYIASCSSDAIQIWRLKKQAKGHLRKALNRLFGRKDVNPLYLFGERKEHTSLAYNPTGQLLATGGEYRSIIIWSTDTWEPIHELEPDDVVTMISSLEFNPEGDLLAASNLLGNVYVWNVRDGTMRNTFRESNRECNCARFTADGKYIFSCGSEDAMTRKGYLSIWRVSDGTLVHSEKTEEKLMSMAVSQNGQKAAARVPPGTITFNFTDILS